MIFKSITPFYLFLFTFTGFVIDGLASSAYAASIPTKTEVISSIQKKQGHLNKKIIISKPGTDIKTAYTLTVFAQPIEFIKPVRKVPSIQNLKKNKRSHHSPIFSNTLNNLGRNFLIENDDSILLQDTLIALSNTRQFLQDTDLMLHDLTENIIASLKLDHLTQNNKPFTQQSSLLSIQQEQNNINSDGQINIYELYRSIINWGNLFYLIAAIIFYAISRAVIKFLFLHRQQKQISRSSRY